MDMYIESIVLINQCLSIQVKPKFWLPFLRLTVWLGSKTDSCTLTGGI